MAYEAKLPDGVTLPPGYSVDTTSERYKEFEAMATRHGLSQSAFSETLGLEARRVAAEHAGARPAAPAPNGTPAPAPAPAAKPNYAKMTTAEKFANSLAASKGRR
jgi:hypothetical protein